MYIGYVLAVWGVVYEGVCLGYMYVYGMCVVYMVCVLYGDIHMYVCIVCVWCVGVYVWRGCLCGMCMV